MDNQYNDELAEYTDRILAGEDMTVSAENRELAQIVNQIRDTIRPDDALPANFRDHLRSRLVDEFNRSTREQRIVQLQRQRTIRRVVQVAAVFVVAGALAVLLDSSGLMGTAGDGDTDVTSLVIALAVIALAGVAFWLISNRAN
ncbi:MAG: hypothetical protein L0154_04235 [Chloroflexi bacterium]|nr:hypothetical protein [Chloroflexota bacterium]